MKSDLVLHIGSHKTGTTTLQRVLQTNKAALAAAGWAYAHGPGTDHLHAYLGMNRKHGLVPDGFRVARLDELMATLTAGTAARVIGSSENFSFLFDAAEIARLAQALRAAFERVRIVVYLRRQDSHLVSHHQEGAKPHRLAEEQLFGREAAALPPWRASHDLYLDYATRLGHWAAAFGAEAMAVRIYDRSRLAEGDVVTDFLGWLGVDPGSVARGRNLNESTGFLRAKLGHLLNAHVTSDEVRWLIAARLPGGGKLLPARAEAEAVHARYRDSNARLAEMFGLAGGAEPFGTDFSMYPETAGDRWSEESATAAIATILGVLEELTRAVGPDELRDAALALESGKPELAHRLMRGAAVLRPAGTLIRKKLADYAQRS
jgi:hypothetical protein